ncbi:MAG: nuclear transport factor 2 family protein [Sphingobium sp.]
MRLTVEQLLDRQEIEDVLISYARGADRGDADLIAAAYHPDAIEDHGGVFVGPASDYVAVMRKILPTAPLMTHICTNITIELDGDHALSECYFLTFSRREGGEDSYDSLTMARCVDRFERRDGAWRIAHRRLAWEWNHEMPVNETWGRGMIIPDMAKAVRGAKKPHDILYGEWAGRHEGTGRHEGAAA